MRNLLTIDVEDYVSLFFRDALGKDVPVSERVSDCTLRMLDRIEEAGARATCFCLGKVAREKPGLVKNIAARGFEVASHGSEHIHFNKCGIDEIRKDLADSKAALEDLTGLEVKGFRAPLFNMSLSRAEGLEALVETGFTYDSSIFPFKGRRYGSPESPRGPYRIVTKSGGLIEFPLAVIEVMGKRLPAAGGGYLRHFPYGYNRWAIKRMNEEGIPATVYLHPYECDVEPFDYPADGLGAKGKLKAALANASQYHGRKGTIGKIERLLSDFSFARARDLIEELASVELEEYRM